MVFDTIVRAVLALVFIFVICLVWKKKKAAIWRSTLLVLLGLCVLTALLAWFVSDQIPKPTEQVRITALGMKNDKSGNNEIYLTGVEIAGRASEFRVSGEERWFWTGNWYVWRNSEDLRRPEGVTDSFVMELPVGKEREISFLSNRNKGFIVADYGGHIELLDCYSKEDGTVKLKIEDSSQSLQVLALLWRSGIFAGSFWILALVSILASFLAGRKKSKKTPLTRTGKKGSTGQTDISAGSWKRPVPTICIFAAVLLIAVLFHPSFAVPKEAFTITALDARNSKSSSDDICLIGTAVDGKEYEAALISSGDWNPEEAGYVWHDSDRSDMWTTESRSIRLQLPVGSDRSVTLLKSSASGYAQLEYDGQIWFLDCYSESAGSFTVRLPKSSDQSLRNRNLMELLMVLCVFAPLFIAVYLPYRCFIAGKKEMLKGVAKQTWGGLSVWLRQDDIVWARRICSALFIMVVALATVIFVRML